MDPKIRQLAGCKKVSEGEEGSFNNTISFKHTVGRNENSMQTFNQVHEKKQKSQQLMKDVFNVVMAKKNIHDLENLDIEEIKTFMDKLSKVKKTAQKIYDKQVNQLIQMQKKKNVGNRFDRVDIDDHESVTSSDASINMNTVIRLDDPKS